MRTETTTYGDWKETRRWMVVTHEKNPAADWIHPRRNQRRQRRVNQTSFKTTSSTAEYWLTYAEAMAVIEANPGRRLYPAYVYSKKHLKDNENPNVNFLDLDIHPENNPEGHDAVKWRDAVVGLFLASVPELRPGISLSGTGRHLVFAMDPAERTQWESLGKLTEIPAWDVGPDRKLLGAAKLEMWNPWGDGRYEVFTGIYDGEGPDTNDLIPQIPFATIMGLLEQLPDRYIKESLSSGAKDLSEVPYPPGPEFAWSELGQAYRLAYSDAAAERHITIIAEGKVYIADDQGVGHDLATTRGRSICGARLFEINRETSARLAKINVAFAEVFQAYIDSVRMSQLTGIVQHLLTFPESNSFKGLVRHTESQAGARLTSSSLNLDFVGGKRRPWIVGADGMVRDIASGAPLKFAAVLSRRITSDRTPLKVSHVEGALDRDNDGARYVQAVSEAWGESLRLVAWLMLAPRKTAGFVIAPWDLGKSLLFSGLQAAGLAAVFDDEVPSRLRVKGRRSNFDYLAKAMTEVTLGVDDDVPTVEASEAVEISVTGIKTLVGSTTLGYEIKGEDRVSPRRRGSLLLTSNAPGPLLNTGSPALKNKLLFILPPLYHSLLDSSADGLDPDILFTPDGQAALVDLMLREMRRVISWKGPRFDMTNLTPDLRNFHDETLADVGSLYHQYKDEQKTTRKRR